MCGRCGEIGTDPLHNNVCELCMSELSSLDDGDRVEWYHHKGTWRPVLFVSLDYNRGSARLVTPVGCEIYRNLKCIRVPGGRKVKV